MRKTQVLIVAFLLVVAPPALLAGKKMTVEDSLGIQSFSGLEWAPDNETMFLVLRNWDQENNTYISHIHKLSSSTGELVQLTRGEKSESNPKVSPDGKLLAFTASRGEEARSQVWILPLEGGESYALTDAENGASGFMWASDSQSVAYVTRDVYPDKEEREKRKKDKDDGVLVDQDFTFNHLWIKPLGDEEARRVTQGEFSVGSMDWSKDGRQIVFQASYSGNQESSWKHIDDRPDTDVQIVDVATGNITNLTPGEGRAAGPRFSPDGKQIAFSASPGVTSGDKNDLILMDLATKRTSNLTVSLPDSVGGATWSADGRSLHFSQGLRAYNHLFRISASGGEPQALTSGLGFGRGFSFSPDGKWLAFSKNDVNAPGDVWVRSAGGGNEKQLTDLNPHIRDYDISKTEVITWASSADGIEIEGVLTYPLDYQPGTRYPMIMSIHGGPTGRSGHSFNARNQVFAANGYAILQPNPRGSSGYGMEFLRGNYMDWGGKDFHDDDMSGADKVIEMGVVDSNRMVVMGGSYGGFSTFWAITQTDRFKAAIGHAAISDWYSFYGQTDIPAYLHWGFGGHIWETRETFEKFSPYNFVQNVVTPILITHGERDMRVPIAQAEQYYTVLKKAGKEVEFLRYPREGHGIREPNHVIDLVGRQLEWFDSHLGIKRDPAPVEESTAKNNQ